MYTPTRKTNYPPYQTSYPPPQNTYTPNNPPPYQTTYPPPQNTYSQSYPPPQNTYNQPPQNYNQQQVPNQWYSSFYNQLNPQQIQQLQLWFNSMDRDRSGTISAQELASVQFNGVPLGLDVAKKLIKVFDKDQNRVIDFMEYATLHQFLNVVQNAFFKADFNRSGKLDYNEMQSALQYAGFNVSYNTLQAVIQKFNPYNQGIMFSTFLLICGHFAHIKSIFDWNDVNKSGRVTLTFDQLCHIGIDILL